MPSVEQFKERLRNIADYDSYKKGYIDASNDIKKLMRGKLARAGYKKIRGKDVMRYKDL